MVETPTEPTKSTDLPTEVDSSIPSNSQNRIGRWTNSEINLLKVAMSIFGD